ncbi:MAG: hypothetical protein WD716_02150 [Fimbriimonadaceae bacterium]
MLLICSHTTINRLATPAWRGVASLRSLEPYCRLTGTPFQPFSSPVVSTMYTMQRIVAPGADQR